MGSSDTSAKKHKCSSCGRELIRVSKNVDSDQHDLGRTVPTILFCLMNWSEVLSNIERSIMMLLDRVSTG